MSAGTGAAFMKKTQLVYFLSHPIQNQPYTANVKLCAYVFPNAKPFHKSIFPRSVMGTK